MSLLSKVKKTIFGYDIFISYSRRDSLDYAYAIAKYFMGRGYECYIDQLSSVMSGEALPSNIKDAVKRATAFVLIGTEGAQLSEPIASEIQLFLENNRNKPLIPITIAGAINSKAVWYKKILGFALIDDTTENLKAGTPAEDVHDRIKNSLKFTKKSARLRKISLIVLLGVLLISTSAAMFSYSKTQEANQAIVAKREADSLKIIALNEKNAAIAAKKEADNLKAIALDEKDEAVELMQIANKKSVDALAQQKVAEEKTIQANIQAGKASEEARKQIRIAEENQKLAKKYENISKARDLANRAEKEVENNPTNAVLLASSAIQNFDADQEIDTKVESIFRGIINKQTGISLGTQSGTVEAIAISPDEHSFASGDENGVIKIWTIDSSGNYKQTYNLKCDGRLTDIEITKDNKHIIVNYLKKHSDNSGSSVCKVWEITDYSTYPTVIFLKEGKLLGISSDKSLMAIQEELNRVGLFDINAIKTNTPLKILATNNNSITNVYFNKKNSVLAAGTTESKVLLWDLNDSKNTPFRIIRTGHFDKTEISKKGINIDIIKFSPDSKKLLAASTYGFGSSANADLAIEIFDISDPGFQKTILKDGAAIKDVFWNDHLISSINVYGEIRSWDDEKFNQVSITNKKDPAKLDFINHPGVTPDGKKLVFGGEMGNLYTFYARDTGFSYGNSVKHFDAVRKLVLGAKGKLALIASRYDVQVNDMENVSSASSWNIGLDQNRLSTSNISTDHKTAMLTYPEKFSFWDITDIKLPQLLGEVSFVNNGFEQNCQGIMFPNGKWAIIQNKNSNQSTLYQLSGGVKKLKILSCRTWCGDFKFSNDSRYLITTEQDTTWLYDFQKFETGLPFRYKISDSASRYSKFNFSPNGDWLAATSYSSKKNNAGRIWFLKNGFSESNQFPINGFEERSDIKITFSPNSDLLVCSESENYAREISENYLLKFYALSNSGYIINESEYKETPYPVNIAFSDKQKWMLTYTNDILLRNRPVASKLWYTLNGIDTSKVFIIPGAVKYFRTFKFSPDERYLVAIQGNEQKWKLWNIDSGLIELNRELKGPSADLNNHWKAFFSPKSDYLIAYNESDYTTPFYFNLSEKSGNGVGFPLSNGNVRINSVRFSNSGDSLFIINSDYFGSNFSLRGKQGSAINLFTKSKIKDLPLVFIKSEDNNIHDFFTDDDFKSCITIGNRITYWNTDLSNLRSKAYRYAGRNHSWDEWLRFGTGQYKKIFPQFPIHSSVFYELLDQIEIAKSNGDTLFMQNKINELTDPLDKSNDPELYNDLGWRLILIGKYQDAVQILNKSILLNPDEGLYRSTRGVAYSYLRNYSKAIEDFEFYNNWANRFQGKNEYVIQRNRWIEKMKQNQFPFTENDFPH
jgi:WD40 repeat protein